MADLEGLGKARQSRRDVIVKAGVAGAVAWTAPTILSMSSPAAAASVQSGIVSVFVTQDAACDPNNWFATITTTVTPDLVGKYLRYFFYWPVGNTFDSCGIYGLSFPLTTTSRSDQWQATPPGLGTTSIGLIMSVTNDCVDTVAQYQPVAAGCGPLPQSIDGPAANSPSTAPQGTITWVH